MFSECFTFRHHKTTNRSSSSKLWKNQTLDHYVPSQLRSVSKSRATAEPLQYISVPISESSSEGDFERDEKSIKIELNNTSDKNHSAINKSSVKIEECPDEENYQTKPKEKSQIVAGTLPLQMSNDKEEIKFDDIFSPLKYPGLDDSEFIIKDVEFNDIAVNYGLIPLHQDPHPILSSKLRSQLFLDILLNEEEKKMEASNSSSPKCLQSILEYLFDALNTEGHLPSLFKINKDLDNLVFNQDHFTFYTRYTTADISNVDEETRFILSVLYADK